MLLEGEEGGKANGKMAGLMIKDQKVPWILLTSGRTRGRMPTLTMTVRLTIQFLLPYSSIPQM